MKKFFSILMVLSILFSLCACGSNVNDEPSTPVSEVTDATDIISACEANGHDWVMPTCKTPKTCMVCGETEGEPTPHEWVEANYQAPKTCSECGTTEGDVLTASYIEHGISINVTEIGTEYDYVTSCSSDVTKKTVGKLHVESYNVVESDENHEALDGYEWHLVEVKILFGDENTMKYGVNYKDFWDNFYESEPIEDSTDENAENTYTVNWNGVNYSECTVDWVCTPSDWTEDGIWLNSVIAVRVPVGYDGTVIGYFDASIEWPEGTSLYEIADENTLFFRLDGNTVK